ncbi:MAG: hypothetical protein WBK76_05090 [Candidatus Saccharimonadales bacterium]
MCNEKSHDNLLQPAHFTRHAMALEQLRAVARRDIGSVSVTQAMQEAEEALSLADSGVDPNCIRQLQQVASGEVSFSASV